MPATSPFSKLMDAVEKFVARHQGQWNHADWEHMTQEATRLGYPCEQDECKRNLGNILESCKFFYNHGGAGAEGGAMEGEGAAPAKKKPAARKKAAP